MLDKLYQSAQANAAPIGALTELYGRAAQANDALGASQSDLIKFTDGVAVALKVGGASAESAQGALLQLGQALGSGTVHAEEFNSVNEGARPILQAVAAGLDKAGGSVAKLRNLVIEGKVSSKEFFQAFLTGLPTIQTMAGNAAQTVEQAFIKINNAFTKYVGQTDEGLGASQRLIVGLNALADNFKETADIVVQLASIIAGALVGRAIAGMLVSLGLAATAVTRFVAALRAASSLASIATAIGGISAAAGPIGLVVGGTAVAALALFSSGSEKASAGAALYAETLKKIREEADKTAPAIERLPEVIQRKLADAIGTGTKDVAAALDDVILQLNGRIDALYQRGGDMKIAADLEKLRDGLVDGTKSADEARDALANLAGSHPQFKALADALESALKKLQESTVAAKKFKAELAGLLDSNQTGVTEKTAYDKSVAAGAAFIKEAERKASLTKDQLALETQIADVKKRAAADSVTLTDAQVKDLAQKELDAKVSRSQEGKATPAVRKTGENRVDNDITMTKDRIAALDLEREAIGLNTGEQQRRQLALQLEQHALADLREEARRNGETNLEAIKLSPEQVAAIDDVSAAWGRASQRMEDAQIAQQHFFEAQQDLGDFAIDLATNWTSVNDALKDGLKLLEQWVLKGALMGEGPLGGIHGIRRGNQ